MLRTLPTIAFDCRPPRQFPLRPRPSLPLAALALLLCAACHKTPGEVLTVVDTDLPVPRMAGRLRVDLYSESGVWYSSRDFGLPNPSDWPASFAVAAGDSSEAHKVLVRLRAYPEGAVRDYQGERFQPRPNPYCPPPVVTRREDLCNPPPDPNSGCPRAQRLIPGEVLTLRIGRDVVVPSLDCDGISYPARAGAAEVSLEIAVAGAYRFGIVDTSAGGGPGSPAYQGGAGFQLLAACDGSAANSPPIACAAALYDPKNGTPLLTRPTRFLAAGIYSLRVVGLQTGPTELTVAAAPPADWDALLAIPPTPQSGPLPVSRLELAGGSDAGTLTPAAEPLPEVAIDRLVLLSVEPGARRRAVITLRGACAATMARLAATPLAQAVVFAEATTCTDSENSRVPVAPETLDDAIGAPLPDSAQNSFGVGADCPGAQTDSDPVCIEGGAFILGDPLAQAWDWTVEDPGQRAAVVSTFLLDRNEVTVKRWRSALARGFAVKPVDAPLVHTDTAECTWTPQPDQYEDAALSCVSWYAARDFCRFEGGDLPTGAQWDYAAWQAGRTVKSRYPWGDKSPVCGFFAAGYGVECPIGLYPGVEGVNHYPGDRTPAGVVGMGGSLEEWALDAAAPYGDDCWHAAPLRDPICDQPEAMDRTIYGSHRLRAFSFAATSVRTSGASFDGIRDVRGFRCAYRAQ